MSRKAASHELGEQMFVGTPRPLPRVLLCHVPTHWCGRHWVANSSEQYDEAIKARKIHQRLCETRAALVVK